MFLFINYEVILPYIVSKFGHKVSFSISQQRVLYNENSYWVSVSFYIDLTFVSKYWKCDDG